MISLVLNTLLCKIIFSGITVCSYLVWSYSKPKVTARFKMPKLLHSHCFINTPKYSDGTDNSAGGLQANTDFCHLGTMFF